MKNLMTGTVWILILYCVIRLTIHAMLSIPADFQFKGSCPPLGLMLTNPPKYDDSPFCDTLKVLEVGNLFWDLFGVKSFLGINENKEVIRVFLNSDKTIPNRGDYLTIEGVFVVLANNSYINNWCGLLAIHFHFMDLPKDRPVQI